MSGNSDRAAILGCTGSVLAAVIGAYATIQAARNKPAEPGEHFQPTPPAAAAASSKAAQPVATEPAAATAPAASSVATQPAAAAPSVIIQNVWLEHNVVSAGAMGMQIHVAFNARHLAGAQLRVAAGIADATGRSLADYDGQYRFDDGTVGVTGLVTPEYAETGFNDYVLFIPYAQLHMRPGSWPLYVKVGVADTGSQGFLAVSDPVPFTYTS